MSYLFYYSEPSLLAHRLLAFWISPCGLVTFGLPTKKQAYTSPVNTIPPELPLRNAVVASGSTVKAVLTNLEQVMDRDSTASQVLTYQVEASAYCRPVLHNLMFTGRWAVPHLEDRSYLSMKVSEIRECKLVMLYEGDSQETRLRKVTD